MSQVAHQAAAYFGYCSTKQLEVILFLLGWDEFTSTYLYTWVERGTVRVKYLAQEHNAMSSAKA